jgi:hypothetical protein
VSVLVELGACAVRPLTVRPVLFSLNFVVWQMLLPWGGGEGKCKLSPLSAVPLAAGVLTQ